MPTFSVLNKKAWVMGLLGTCILGLLSTSFILFDKEPGHRNILKERRYEQQVYFVNFSQNGFEPNEITVYTGDKVIFVSDDIIPFWPASNPHPTHENYSEFDPKNRIFAPENWEFTFQKEGTWDYHDHINDHATGRIIVVERGSHLEEEVTLVTDCKKITDQYQKQRCWDDNLVLVLEEKGLKEAFAFFVELYNTDPEIPKACHEWGHTLGKASFKQYLESGELILVPEASYCGYGYFHSFIGEMIKNTGTVSGIKDFCAQVERELGDELPNIHRNCIHGVGHGTTAWLLENPDNWGNFQKTATEGTKVCEELYTVEIDLSECYDGVYNELHLDLFNDQYGFDFKSFSAKNDPFWICNEQEDRHKESCYFEFVGIFWKIFDLNLESAITYVVNNLHDIEKTGPRVISKIVADWIQFDIVNTSFNRNIEACRIIPQFLFEPCIDGTTNGFIQHGNPKDLHTKAFEFCQADYLFKNEKVMCFDKTMGSLSGFYNREQMLDMCSKVPRDIRAPWCANL
jgi:plastocyanin